MFLLSYKDSSIRKCAASPMARKNMEALRARLKTSPKGQSVSPISSPVRGSPTGHYAGCKWTEPPSPSTLPPPPQHWMQTTHSIVLPFRQPQSELENQFKVLVEVQA